MVYPLRGYSGVHKGFTVHQKVGSKAVSSLRVEILWVQLTRAED